MNLLEQFEAPGEGISQVLVEQRRVPESLHQLPQQQGTRDRRVLQRASHGIPGTPMVRSRKRAMRW